MARKPLTVGPVLQSSTIAATALTVPAGHEYLITQIHVLNLSSSDQGFALSIGTLGATTELFNGLLPVLRSGGVYDWPCNLDLAAAAFLQTACGLAGTMLFTFMGWDYTIG